MDSFNDVADEVKDTLTDAVDTGFEAFTGGLNAGAQLLNIDRFGEVDVSPTLQASAPLFNRIEGSHHQNRNCRRYRCRA